MIKLEAPGFNRGVGHFQTFYKRLKTLCNRQAISQLNWCIYRINYNYATQKNKNLRQKLAEIFAV